MARIGVAEFADKVKAVIKLAEIAIVIKLMRVFTDFTATQTFDWYVLR